MDSGVARKPIVDFEVYKDELKQRLDPTVTIMQGINNHIKKNQKELSLLMERMKIILKQQLRLKIQNLEFQF